MQGFGTETGLVSGERLERLLDERRIGKRELSLMSGLAYTMVCRMCGGELAGSLYSWVRVTESLGVGVSMLTGDVGGRKLSVRQTRSSDICGTMDQADDCRSK